MLLLKTKLNNTKRFFVNNQTIDNSLLHYYSLSNYFNILKYKFFLLENTKSIFNVNFKTYIRNDFKIYYVFFISFSYSNIFINVLDINSKKIVKTVSLGVSKLKNKSDKTAKKYFIIQLVKNTFFKIKKFKPISIHFIGTKLIYNRLIINILKKLFTVQSIKLYNLIPHNGCRPRKKRRK